MISLSMVILVGIFCVAMQAFFAGSEIALVSSNRVRIRQKAAEGDRGARMVEELLEKPQVLLATTLVGTNLAILAFAVTVSLWLLGSGNQRGELFAIAVVTPLTLIFGSVVPKTLFQQYADRIVTKIVYPLQAAAFVLKPLISFFAGLTTRITRVLGVDVERALVTRDELALLIESETASESRSEITRDEREMISNVLELSEAVAKDVMVPLSEVTALPESTTLEAAIREVADKRHSRMPVYRSRVDDIVGILHVFDLLQAHRAGKQGTAGGLTRPATFIPENKPVVDLLVELKGTGNQMAVVVDEYGGAVGVLTVEDILEEIVGDIEDEYDEGPLPIRQERPGVWRVAARIPVSRVNEELKIELPEGDEYESLAGLMLAHFKRIPDPGESIAIGGVTLRVLKATGRAIEEIQILRRRK
jgi:CBS domain containing-hemolysin-like protein